MITVVIPVYKNTSQFIANLKTNLPFLDRCEIIIVNDNPDASIKSKLPKGDIRLIENKKNLGFAGAVDTGIRHANNRYIMLLNSDVVLLDSSYMLGLTALRNSHDLFAVSFAQKEKDASIVGKNRIYWKNGYFLNAKAGNMHEGINGWAEGGACIMDRKKYNEIGGFDNLFSPYYWEDIDLSYRAWKHGYRILFNPSIVVEHHHESTIGKYFANEHIKTIAFRNQFIFMWKNLEDRSLIAAHIGGIFRSVPTMLIRERSMGAGFLKALIRLPSIIGKRRSYTIKDKDILSKFI